MSLRPQPPLPPVPDDTAGVARAAFRRGTPYLLLRDRLGAVFADADFADPYPALGQPAYAPWRLALVTLMQFREGHGCCPHRVHLGRSPIRWSGASAPSRRITSSRAKAVTVPQKHPRIRRSPGRSHAR